MSNERFIELLNLYLDDEILPEDLSELMDETRRDSRRQKVFLDYCRIHKACSQIGSSYSPRRPSRSWRHTVYALGGLAAAVAFLAMAGRNLMPFAQGGATEVATIREDAAEKGGAFASDALEGVFAEAPFFMVSSRPGIDLWNTDLSGSEPRQAAPFVLRVGEIQGLLDFEQEGLFMDSWRLQGREDFGLTDILSPSGDTGSSFSRFDFSANGLVPVTSSAVGPGVLTSKLRLNN